MSAVIVIPARYASTRFPGKPLLRESGKFLIQHVVEQAQRAQRASRVVVATDDRRIRGAVVGFGAAAVMTSPEHASGTDRIAEVMRLPEFAAFDVVVNVQGDEPEISPALIDELIAVTERDDVGMATVAAPFDHPEDIGNPNMVKVVLDAAGGALYFSRSVIPHDRDKTTGTLGRDARNAIYHKHLGIYAYRRSALLQMAEAPPCALETIEKLEQLRALYLGIRIHVVCTQVAPHGIDTPADYAAFLQRLGAGSVVAR